MKKEKKKHSTSVNEYAKKTYDRLQVLLPKGTKEKWTDAARNRGFINKRRLQ